MMPTSSFTGSEPTSASRRERDTTRHKFMALGLKRAEASSYFSRWLFASERDSEFYRMERTFQEAS